MAKLAGVCSPLPEDLVFSEILTRLPAKPLLRCHAVSRSWRRRLTSDAQFLLAHHRRQPSLPLVTTGDRSSDERRIDVLDHRTGERRPVARTTGRTVVYGDEDGVHVLASGRAVGSEGCLHVFASCDGLLILLSDGGIEICNPATRERALLTGLQCVIRICALYPHRPSGSYRVLCCFESINYGKVVYSVYTVGSGERRCVGEPTALPILGSVPPPVLAGGRIYGQPINLPGGTGNGKGNNMLVFDTMSESFEHLLSPVGGGEALEIFEMSNGSLGLYDTGGFTADLWVLQDHESWTWSLINRIKLPDAVIPSPKPVLDPAGDLLVLSVREGPSVDYQHLQHISGPNGSLLARYEWNSSLNLRRHRFKESLVRHDFFPIEGNADEKPLFDGLSTVALVRDDNSEPH